MFISLTKRFLIIFAGLLLLANAAFAASIIDGAKDGPAVEGYDVVAYFTQGKPIEGKPEFVTEWNGAKWQFQSAENRDLFVSDPEKYAPQYGGHCAYAMSFDSFASGDPHRWKIEEGKLYLNANKFAQWRWEKNIPKNIKDADGYWPAKKKQLEDKKS